MHSRLRLALTLPVIAAWIVMKVMLLHSAVTAASFCVASVRKTTFDTETNTRTNLWSSERRE